MVSKLDGVVHDALGVAERDGAHLALGAKVEVVLEQLSAQLAPRDVEAGLELLVSETGGLAVAQEADETLVERVGGREGVCVLAQGRDLRLFASLASPAFPFASRRARSSR